MLIQPLGGLEVAIQAAGDQSRSPQERITSAYQGSEIIAGLGGLLDDGEFEHVFELVAFIDGLVNELPSVDRRTTEAVLGLVSLLREHVVEPGNKETVERLVKEATAGPWEFPLAVTLAQTWHNLPSDLSYDRLLTLTDESNVVTASTQIDDIAVVREVGTVGAANPALRQDLAESDNAVEEPAIAQVLPSHAFEMLEVLAAGVEATAQEIDVICDTLGNSADGGQRQLGMDAYKQCILCWSEAAKTLELAGLVFVCEKMLDSVAQLSTQAPLSPSLIERLRGFKTAVHAYLTSPLSPRAQQGLVRALNHPDFANPLDDGACDALIAALAEDPLHIAEEGEQCRPTEVSEDDLSLSPLDDADVRVLAEFHREAPLLARKLNEILYGVTDDADAVSRLQEAQRYAHTLKGSSATCGIRGISTISHYLEDLLEAYCEAERLPSGETKQAILTAADAIEMMLEHVTGVEHYAADAFRDVVQEVLDWVNRIDSQGIDSVLDAAFTSVAESGKGKRLADRSEAVDPLASTSTADSKAEQTSPSPSAETAETEHYFQVPTRTLDAILGLVGEISISLAQAENQLAQSGTLLEGLLEQERGNLNHVQTLENLVDIRGIGIEMQERSRTGRSDEIDPLELEEYNELYITARCINEGVSDAREFSQGINSALQTLSELNLRHERLTQEIQEHLMRTRLVPVSDVVPRFERIVRHATRAALKEAALIVEGRDILLDNAVLTKLTPALMHVLRNSVDHGIEPPAERVAKGKPREGRMVLRFRQKGDRLEIEFEDDGRGLDFDRIREKAIERGLLHGDDELEPVELAALTLKSGFSTRAEVTQLSGRGIGMNVVETTVRALNGIVRIAVDEAPGYRLSMRVPTSLLSVYCLVVRVAEQTLAIPANVVMQVVWVNDGRVIEQERNETFRFEDKDYPLIYLQTLMGLGNPGGRSRMGHGCVLLVSADTGVKAVLVDELIDSRELIVKRLGRFVPRSLALSSATIMGDGNVALIIDLQVLLRVDTNVLSNVLPKRQRQLQLIGLPTILVVDDSLSMRRSLSQLVGDAGYQAVTARDGMHALTVMRETEVDLAFVDLEMPQMNGFELIAHLRSQSVTTDLPIAVISSRSTQGYRQRARDLGANGYFAKPYRDEDLLDFIQTHLRGRSTEVKRRQVGAVTSDNRAL